MKKSEMKEILFNKMKTFWNFQDVSDWDIREQASILLELMEENGMLPPKNPSLSMSMVVNKKNLYTWEQEDPDDDNYDKIKSGCK